jgi:hypothetical protein
VTDRSRGVYLGMARLFLLVGAVVGLLGLVDQILAQGIFRGNPIWTSLFLLGIGGLLYWTATTAESRAEVVEADEDHDPRPYVRRHGREPRDGYEGREER